MTADRMRGALFGAALGDACGLATEFLSQQRVAEFYGGGFHFRPGCAVYPDTHRGFFPKGDWTDDTDQLVLVLQSLLTSEGKADQADFAARLKHWAAGGFPELGDRCGSGLGKTVGKVVNAKDFEQEPALVAERVWRTHGGDLAANGALMRAAVCGFPSFWSLEASEKAAVDICRVTHFDSRCVASCVCVSVAVSCLLMGRGPVEAMREALERASRHLEAKHEEQFCWYVSPQRTLDDLELDEPRTIGYTFKALACSLIALRSERSFEETIQDIVRRGGDADTNAVVVGALLGCARGFGGLPEAWIAALPYAQWLEAWACQALDASGLSSQRVQPARDQGS